MNFSNADSVLASRSVLIEALGVLGAFRSQLVIVGGWVPDLLLSGRGHMGSLDVDLAVDVRGLPQSPYGTMRQRLCDAGYLQRSTNMFERAVGSAGRAIAVRVDLLAGQFSTSADPQDSQRVQELQVSTLRGIDLALDSFDEVRIEGIRPDQSRDTLTARAASLPAFVCMKAFALAERQKEKDAYDIYFCVRHGDSDRLASGIKALPNQSLAGEATELLREKFASIDHVGPTFAATVAAENGEDFEQARRAAFELAKRLLALV